MAMPQFGAHARARGARALLLVSLAAGGLGCSAGMEAEPPQEEPEPARGGSGGGGAGGSPGRVEPPRTDAEVPAARDAGSDAAPADAGAADAAPRSDAAPSRDATAAEPDGGTQQSYLDKVVPALFINVNGQTIVKGTKINGTFKVVEDHDGSGSLTTLQARPATVEGRLGIEIRGNSSSGFAQKPYGIEIRDAMGNSTQVSLLGLPRESDFVLHSCYSDKTCMRNALTYTIGREIAEPAGRWAPRTRWVELYLDNRYQGLYLLVEKIKRDRFRVALPEPAPSASAGDITGGYIISLEGDRMKGPGRTFQDPLTTGRWWAYRSPSYSNITSAQRTYIQMAHATLVRAIDANPRWNEVKKLIEPASWIDYMIVQELTNNTDGYPFSFYLHKQSDANGGKWSMGPIWDFDIGYGNLNYNKRYCTNTLLTAPGVGALRPFRQLFADPNLHDEMRCRYLELRKPGGPLDVARIEAHLDTFVRHTMRAKMRDQMRWTNIGKYVWPNNYLGATWADEVGYLKFWIRRRLAFLDANLPGTCSSMPRPPTVSQTTYATPVRETTSRTPICCSGAPVYIRIEGPVDPMYANWACPM